MPRVTIQYNSSLDQAYQQILKELDARHHNYQLSPGVVAASQVTEEQAGELETMAAHAAHAGQLYRQGTHIERLLG